MRIQAYLPAIVFVLSLVGTLRADEPLLLLRAESLTVLPKSKPMLYIRVANPSPQPVRAKVSVQVPKSWQVDKLSESVELAAGLCFSLSPVFTSLLQVAILLFKSG